jgi:uncharacterized protein
MSLNTAMRSPSCSWIRCDRPRYFAGCCAKRSADSAITRRTVAASSDHMSARLEVVARPGARTAGIVRRGTDVVVTVRERAVDGKANDAIVRAVAAWLGIAASRVGVLHGGSGRRKLLAIDGVDDTALCARIAALADG